MQQNDGFIEQFEIDGAANGPLHGLSFAVKDLYEVKGRVTGAGSPEWAEGRAPAEEHAYAVETLLAAGARLVGKTHTDEFAYSVSGVNAHYGAPVNPSAPGRTTGGSSSGSASVAAAGLADFTIGSDTGGSVRLPASYCGLYGIRTTHGAIASDGLLALAPSYDTVGWFARDAETFARVGAAFDMEAPDLDATPEIVAPLEPWDGADPATRKALKAAGAEIGIELTPSEALRLTDNGLDAWREAFRVHQAWEVWRVHGAWMEKHAPDLGPGVRERFAAARDITDEAAAAAHDLREAAKKRMRDVLQGDRILAVPSTPGPAPLYGLEASEEELIRQRALALLCVAGHAGLPQISIPLATVDGAPVGLGLIGSPGEDGLLLAVARILARRMAAAG